MSKASCGEVALGASWKQHRIEESAMAEWEYRQVTVCGQTVSEIDGQAISEELPYATVVNELHAEGWALERELSVSQDTATVQFRRTRVLRL
jgi:hypothetical protein